MSKRIAKEFAELSQSPPSGIKVSLVSESDLHLWDVVLEGPKDTPYAGGKYKLQLSLPKEYPFKAPVVNFKTRIYHPNITNDEKGSMCIGILKPDQWKPACMISGALVAVQDLLREPVPDDAVETSIAEQYKNDRAGFDKTAKAATKQHATSWWGSK
ncbi:ubiquitin-protein ligase [Bisporella sp. PMI_857]|nr:ubiquitin-protein ligase [Bisporella sp. PMI_857]